MRAVRRASFFRFVIQIFSFYRPNHLRFKKPKFLFSVVSPIRAVKFYYQKLYLDIQNSDKRVGEPNARENNRIRKIRMYRTFYAGIVFHWSD